MSPKPTIIADDRIPFVREAFQQFGTLTTMPGRDMNAITIRNADILIVRSITRVDELLIGKSRVRYVATASTGFDHIDIKFLKKRKIRFFTATGCNANSVSEYVSVAIAELCKRFGLVFGELTIGVIGVGKIGTRVAKKAEALGMKVLLNDPPLKDETGDVTYVPLETVLRQSDIITLHVPLTGKGKYPTENMANRNFFGLMKPGSILINTSRGMVVDEEALLEHLGDERIRATVLDVWRNEPDINTKLLKNVDIGTSHIAGHSVDGQVNATVMVYNDLCRYLKKEPEWQPRNLPPPEQPDIRLGKYQDMQEKLTGALLHVYPITHDNESFRRIIDEEDSMRPALFDKIRNERYVRREFDSYRVTGCDEVTLNVLNKLGFKV